jgi:hypothetical protein
LARPVAAAQACSEHPAHLASKEQYCSAVRRNAAVREPRALLVSESQELRVQSAPQARTASAAEPMA